ncbi:MAG: hypothetical protein AAB562_02705 [Patescibacteria group bacterium]
MATPEDQKQRIEELEKKIEEMEGQHLQETQKLERKLARALRTLGARRRRSKAARIGA